ncbi:hypothetical protein ACVW0P_003486 [Mucilaginibacter sp. UYNi724]
MKKIILLLMLFCAVNIAKAQKTAVGPIEQKFTTSLCDCLSKLDQTTITTSEEANKAFMECFMAQSDLLVDLAAERNVTMDDGGAMNKIGADIGANLLKQKCSAFIKLAVKMNDKKKEDAAASLSTSGTFKRIDSKGFNYIVITDATGSEKSFIWLRQFPGSENFMGLTTKYTGKKLKVTWQEMEVYLPAAKGYYKVKEIVGVDVL